jgi:hypothetical protein
MVRAMEELRIHTSGTLTAAPDLATARRAVAAAVPGEPAHEDARRRILAFVDDHADALLRSCSVGHLTARRSSWTPGAGGS